MANQDDKKLASKPSRSAPKRKPVTIEGESKPVAKPASTAASEKSSPPLGRAGAKQTESKSTSSAAKPGPDAKGAQAKANASSSGSPKASSATQAPKTAAAKPSGEQSKGGLRTGLLGGVAGGALVALLAGGWSLVSGGGGATGLEDLQAQNAALVERVAAVEAVQDDMGDADPNSELAQRINVLSGQIQDLSSSSGADVDLTPVTDRIAALEGLLEEAQASAQRALDTASDLQSQVESGGSGDAPALAAQSARLDELSAGLEGLQAQLAEVAEGSAGGEPVNLGPVTGRLESLAVDLEQARASNEAMATSVQENASALADTKAGLEGLQTSVAALSDAMGNAQSAIASRDDEQRVARAALAAATLAATIDGGKPFATELDSFASITSGSDSLAAGADAAEVLRPFADAGVPTLASLQAQWPAVADAILVAVRPEPENITDRFASNLRGLVSVRPAGDVGGGGPTATVGRMTTALDEGQLAQFASARAELPEEGQAASAEFAKRVAARLEANSLLTSVLAGASSSASNSAAETASEGDTQ
ncbi:MAG: hypothetical protein AAFY73_08825 [Pseudomonadota bacterium]